MFQRTRELPAAGLAARLARYVPRGGFARKVAVLAGGTTIGQVLALAASPALSRLYSPAEFGLLGVFVSLEAVMLVVASLRYEMAIPLPEDEDTARQLLNLSFVALLGMAVLTGLAVIFCGDWLLGVLRAPGFKPFLWTIPLGFLGGGAYQILNQWAVRGQAFSHVGNTRVSQTLGCVLSQMLLGFARVGTLGLLIGQLVSVSGGVGSLGRLAWPQGLKSVGRLAPSAMLKVARRYASFPLLSAPASLCAAVGLYFPLLIIASCYGPVLAGWFALGQKVVGMPTRLVGAAVGQVYFGSAAELARLDARALERLYLRVAACLLLVGLAPVALLALAGPWGFGWVFGESWRGAGALVQVMAPMYLLQFVVAPLAQTTTVLEKQQVQLCWDAGRALLTLASFALAVALRLPAEGAIALYSASMTLAYAAFFLWMRRLVKARA